MRISIIGSLWLGAQVFKGLREDGHEIPFVFAPEGDDRLRRAAVEDGVPVLDDALLRDDARACAAAREIVGDRSLELIVAAHSFRFVRAGVRSLALHGAIGFHPSLLPAYRGRNAIEDALRAGERVLGGSVYRLDEGWDTGHVLARESVALLPDETAGDVWRRALAPMGLRLLRAVAASVAREGLEPAQT